MIMLLNLLTKETIKYVTLNNDDRQTEIKDKETEIEMMKRTYTTH